MVFMRRILRGGGEEGRPTPIPPPITRREETGRPSEATGLSLGRAGHRRRSAESPREREASVAGYLLREAETGKAGGPAVLGGGVPVCLLLSRLVLPLTLHPDQCPQVGNISAPIPRKNKAPLGSWAVGGGGAVARRRERPRDQGFCFQTSEPTSVSVLLQHLPSAPSAEAGRMHC